jgi:hypothetical protein
VEVSLSAREEMSYMGDHTRSHEKNESGDKIGGVAFSRLSKSDLGKRWKVMMGCYLCLSKCPTTFSTTILA